MLIWIEARFPLWPVSKLEDFQSPEKRDMGLKTHKSPMSFLKFSKSSNIANNGVGMEGSVLVISSVQIVLAIANVSAI